MAISRSAPVAIALSALAPLAAAARERRRCSGLPHAAARVAELLAAPDCRAARRRYPTTRVDADSPILARPSDSPHRSTPKPVDSSRGSRSCRRLHAMRRDLKAAGFRMTAIARTAARTRFAMAVSREAAPL